MTDISQTQAEFKAIPHNSKCRYGERGVADAKPKEQIILDAAKVSAASGGNSEPKQGQRSQNARGFCPRSTMRVQQPDIIEHFGNADAVPQLPERCLSRKAGIVRYCPSFPLFLENKSILNPLNPALKAPDSFQTTIIIAEKVSMKRMIAATLMFSLLLSATACGKLEFI